MGVGPLAGELPPQPRLPRPAPVLRPGLHLPRFTATDYTARISPAIFGMAVAAMPLALRRWLGPVGTIAAVAFIAFSPTVVYYSRFLRMDIYLAFFMLLMVVAMWRYLEEGACPLARRVPGPRRGLAFAFSTKEVTFLVAAMFLLYLNGHLATDLAQATLRDRGTDAPWRRFVLAAAYFPYAWAAAALWPFLGRLRRSAAWGELPRPGDLLILTARSRCRCSRPSAGTRSRPDSQASGTCPSWARSPSSATASSPPDASTIPQSVPASARATRLRSGASSPSSAAPPLSSVCSGSRAPG